MILKEMPTLFKDPNLTDEENAIAYYATWSSFHPNYDLTGDRFKVTIPPDDNDPHTKAVCILVNSVDGLCRISDENLADGSLVTIVSVDDDASKLLQDLVKFGYITISEVYREIGGNKLG